jgi:hypothetical protein
MTKAQPVIPSEEDWGDYRGNLDQEYAHRVFAGKDVRGVIPDFERAVYERADEIRFMPPIPFRYYLLAYAHYVMLPTTAKHSDASDAAGCFLNLVEQKLVEAPSEIAPIAHQLLDVIEYIGSNQSAFQAPKEIYGDFAAQAERVVQMIRGGPGFKS